MVYNYAPDGLVNWIDDTDAAGAMSTTTFQYDNRNRLTDEVRTGQTPYDLSYTYDAGGNRLTKTDNATGWITTYNYDITDVNDGGQHNNRLLSYTISDGAQAVEQASYDYGPDGNVARLIRWFPTHPTQSRVYWFYYDTSDHLWMAVSATGEYDPTTGSLTNCVNDLAAEYRYDSGRARYLVRPRDPTTLAVLPGAQWRDYDGDAIYDDYTLTVDPAAGTVTVTVNDGPAYLAGVGFDCGAGSAGIPACQSGNMPSYYHGDLIGSTRAVTDQSSAIAGQLAYTAFGEPISATGATTRYTYAGAWGYETAEPFDPLAELGWLHVGARYYDPALGRFVQRDPIGIEGGLNAYAYVSSSPVLGIDTDGLTTVWVNAPPGGIRYDTGTRVAANRPRRIVQSASAVNRQGLCGLGRLGKVYEVRSKLETIGWTPYHLACAALGDVITTIFVVPIQWIVGTDDGYKPGDATRQVWKGTKDSLKR